MAIKKEGVSERTGRRARDELRKAGLIDKNGGGGNPWEWFRTVEVGQSGESVDKWPTRLAKGGEVGQPLAKLKPLQDKNLSNLSNQLQTPGESPEEVGQLPLDSERLGHLRLCDVCDQDGDLIELHGVPVHLRCAPAHWLPPEEIAR